MGDAFGAVIVEKLSKKELENLAPFEDETSEASTAETEIEKGKDF
jgi:hypothetical protein